MGKREMPLLIALAASEPLEKRHIPEQEAKNIGTDGWKEERARTSILHFHVSS